MKPTLAKITRPTPTAGVFHRKRLFRLLDRHRKQPVVWVSGPPGSGKTTLISSYLETRKLTNLWYQVDTGDSDIASFFYYMGIAAKKAAPRRRKPLPLLAPEYLMGIPTFTRNYFEDLFSRLKLPFAVVLDNYQEAADNSKFHKVIRDAMAVIPEGGQIIVVSRKDPPPEMARLRANRIIQVLDQEELLLTADETQSITLLLGGKSLSKKMILQMLKKTKGWIAGLILLIEQHRIKGTEPGSFDQDSHELIFDYFAGEILQKTDTKTNEFLLKTAILPNMTVPMAKKLTGSKRAGPILSHFNQHNYFTDKRSHPALVYQYHPLFREFLLSRAENFFKQTDLIQLKKKAASLLEESDQVEDAALLLREAGDWKGVERLIMGHARNLMTEGRFLILGEWLQSIPEEILKKKP